MEYPRVFTVYGKPVPKARPRITRQGRAYTPKTTKEYEELIKRGYLTRFQKEEPFKDIPLMVDIDFYLPIPKSYSKKKLKDAIADIIKPIGKRGDIDNYCKCVLDALNGIAYEDDCCVVELIANKYYSDTPRTVISIYDVTDQRNADCGWK